jgi:hypothetical protein|mmetsp:Transcript_78573/g.131140  ORF Transcript_78573/g.131140 Transcript_78573/m.131140 type:complete len:109 (+) Transcript_78573:3060-3386(+)
MKGHIKHGDEETSSEVEVLERAQMALCTFFQMFEWGMRQKLNGLFLQLYLPSAFLSSGPHIAEWQSPALNVQERCVLHIFPSICAVGCSGQLSGSGLNRGRIAFGGSI